MKFRKTRTIKFPTRDELIRLSAKTYAYFFTITVVITLTAIAIVDNVSSPKSIIFLILLGIYAVVVSLLYVYEVRQMAAKSRNTQESVGQGQGKMKSWYIQVIISSIAIVLLILHSVWPDWKIDSITIVLLVIAIIPWLAPLFKSLELPGGWKVEFRELKNAEQRAKSAGLLSPQTVQADAVVYPFQLVEEGDANLALAGLRIEIEKRLRKIADSMGLQVDKGGIRNLLNVLGRTGALNQEERSVLEDMLGLLNSAVHGASVDKNATSWAMEVGPLLLQTLEEKVSK